jgi:SIR2-like domain
MSWNVRWCRGRTVAPGEDTGSEEEVLAKVRNAIGLKASDLRITRTLEPYESNPEYHNIAPAFCQRRVIPFLGAGASYSARETGSSWSPLSPFPPTSAELAHWLAEACGLPAWLLSDVHNLSRVASYYVLTSPKKSPQARKLDLLQKLAEVFRRAREPGLVHTFLARHAVWAPVIVTTNYDMLMEEAFIRAKQPFNKIVHLADVQWQGSLHLQEYRWNEDEQAVALAQDEPRRLTPDELQREFGYGKPPLLYKMHGSVDSGAFVITEEDYIEFLSGRGTTSVVPPALLRYFKPRSFLFLGYSLEDWNFRVILQNLEVEKRWPDGPESETGVPEGAAQRSIGGASLAREWETAQANVVEAEEDRRHWAVQLGATTVDTAVWQNRHVKITDMDLNQFVAGLEVQIREWARRNRGLVEAIIDEWLRRHPWFNPSEILSR